MRPAGWRTTAAGPVALTDAASRATRRLAEEDHPSVVELIQRLVRIPSRGGIDPYDPVLGFLLDWFAGNGLNARLLPDERASPTGRNVGIVCDIIGAGPGPRYVLDACADTAPFGDPSAWRHPPTSAVIEDGWLYGRGSADSKAAIAIFAHLAVRLRDQVAQLRGTLTVLFDADEHSGGFGGAKAYFGGGGAFQRAGAFQCDGTSQRARAAGDPGAPEDGAGVMIGYPGVDQIVVGGRGFLRARIAVRGRSGHTGSEWAGDSGNAGSEWVGDSDNAAVKAAYLVAVLARHGRPGPTDPALNLPPRLTVTAIHGGEGYSVVPDRCEVDVDVRLTPSFDRDAAEALIGRVVAGVDEEFPAGVASIVEFRESWPAYHLGEAAPVRAALALAARRQVPQPPPARVAGPSNIGNYLAMLGIEATAGLGVRYRGLHGADECIDCSTVPMVQATYHEAVLSLLAAEPADERAGSIGVREDPASGAGRP